MTLDNNRTLEMCKSSESQGHPSSAIFRAKFILFLIQRLKWKITFAFPFSKFAIKIILRY